MSSEGAAEICRIIDAAEDVAPEAPLTSGVRFSRIPARAGGMKLRANDWQVLHAISLHADKSGWAYPSLERIARIAGIRRNHVSRSVRRLEKLGLIKSCPVRLGSGWANTNYQVIFDDAEAAPETKQPVVASPDVNSLVGTAVPEMGLPAARVAPEMVLGVTSVGSTGGTQGCALTDHLTDLAKEKVIEEIQDQEASDLVDERMRSKSQQPRPRAIRSSFRLVDQCEGPSSCVAAAFTEGTPTRDEGH